MDNNSEHLLDETNSLVDETNHLAEERQQTKEPVQSKWRVRHQKKIKNQAETPKKMSLFAFPSKGLLALMLSCLFLFLGATLCFIYLGARYAFLPRGIMLRLTIVLVLLQLIFWVSALLLAKLKWVQLLISILALLLAGALTFGDFYYYKAAQALASMTSSEGEVRETKLSYSVLVAKDSALQSETELSGKKLAAPTKLDPTRLNEYLSGLTKGYHLVETISYLESVKLLLNHEVDAMVLASNWLQTIEEQDPDFQSKTRALHKGELVTKVKPKVRETKQNTTQKPFNIYISGNDNFGDIAQVSRSDVNIIATVNPALRKVLLTNIPRDTYVRVTGEGQDQYDKLTHAGLYGVETSMSTIAKLLQTKCDLYARINFDGLIRLVDDLGGITLDNPSEFTGYNGTTFQKGRIELDGQKALEFSRERYSLPGGDFDRGRHQELVLKAMIHQILSPEALTHIDSILERVKQSIDMNLTMKEISSLIQMQLTEGGDWQVEMQALEGEGSMDQVCYTAPNQRLYVMIPNEDSLQKVSMAIYKLLTAR